MKKTITSLLTFTLVLLATVSAQAQVRFERGRLYVIRPNSATGQSWSSGKSGEAVKLGKTDATDAAQQWTVTELSGSYRLINPFSGLAAHATADGRVAMTEDNGSDESQLWLIEPVGEAYLLVPSNGPSKAARQRRDGTVELIDKAKARTDRAAQFRFEPSSVAGFDSEATYRILALGSRDLREPVGGEEIDDPVYGVLAGDARVAADRIGHLFDRFGIQRQSPLFLRW